MASKRNEVAKVDSGAALAIPDYLLGRNTGKGLQALSQSDYTLPRIKLMQATDNTVQEGSAAAGDFYHLTSKVNLGKVVNFVPILVSKRYMLFSPTLADGSGGEVLARADDGEHWNAPNRSFEVTLKNKKKAVWKTGESVSKSGLGEFGSSDPEDPKSPPAALLIYDVLAYLTDFPHLSPVAISLKSTAVARAKNFFTGLNQAGLDIFCYQCRAYGSIEKKGNNSYWNYNLEGNGFVPKELLPVVEAIYKRFETVPVKVMDDAEDKVDAGAASSPEAPRPQGKF
jgi:hypothetical protein